MTRPCLRSTGTNGLGSPCGLSVAHVGACRPLATLRPASLAEIHQRASVSVPKTIWEVWS